RAITPVVVAVVVCGRLLDDLRASLSRPLAMGVGIVHADTQRLRICTADRTRALAGQRYLASRSATRAADHDQTVTVRQLRVLDAPALACDQEADLEVERLAEPGDGLGSVV